MTDQLDEMERLKAENQRLKEESRRFSHIINMSLNPVWQRNKDLKVTYCNLAFSEVAEQSMESLVDLSELDLFTGQREMVRAALETGEEQHYQQHIVVRGERRLFDIREVPLRSEGLINGYAIDITEREEAESEIRRHIEAQRDFLESSTSAMAIFSSDMRLQFYNYAFVRLWRLAERFLDSKPTYGEILERLREERRLPEQANFPAFKQHHIKLFKDLIDPHEEFFYLPDGKILRVVIIPHALGGLMFAYEDVTDRLALERSYNTLIAVQRETLDNLNEALVVIGEDGRIKLSNPTFTALWELEDKLLHNEPHVRELLDLCKHHFEVQQWSTYRDAFIGMIQKRAVNSGRIERFDGRVLDWRSIPLPDGGTLLTYTDMTDSTLVERSLREKNDALEAADRLKSEFLANVSYELRSPLTSISGFSDILRNDYFGELTSKQREYVEGIHQSAQQLGHLINNILDLSSIEAGYMQLDISEFDLYDLMESVFLLLKERMKILDLSVVNECDPHVGMVRADETRLKQVIFNLLSNAAKYSRPGGVIEVKAYAEGADNVVIRVEDHGVGISADKQGFVFDKFYRAGAVTGQQAGSGLGLSIVKSFIELHGGSVVLDSIPGAGTIVTAIIPRNPAKGAN